MSSLRFDCTTNDWVIFAPERARRPHEYRGLCPPVDESESGLCPFCPGNEYLTGKEIYAVRGINPDPSRWLVRVIPNKFPALRIEDQPERFEDGPLFRHMGGCGAHEVIIESPDHERTLAQQPVEHIERLIGVLHFRFVDLLRDGRFQTIVIFKNHGERAGTSLRHPHWQLIATPVVPRLLRLKHQVATDYFDLTGRCVYCQMLADELAFGKRVVAENNHFAAVCPYASHVPFEMWIMPKTHRSSFADITDQERRSLAELLGSVLRKLHVALENPHYNLTIDTASRGDEDKRYFLWHIRILPRLTTPAGFELGSGMSINLVLPEEAAAYLRDTPEDSAT
ncbi:MAG: galactose-1-phosphate uridylyltransferase [Gemmataceae bacterium]